MTRDEAIELIDDRMCFGRGKWSKYHEPEIDEYWQAGQMAIEALKAQDVPDTNVGDMISKKAVLQRLTDIAYNSCKTEGQAQVIDWAKTLVCVMPSAQPLIRTEMPSADDLISRQAAIDVADAVWSVTGDKNVAKVWDQIKDLPSAQPEKVCIAKITLSEEQVREAVEKAKSEIVQVLSPAQPEIIRCKDCKWYGRVDKRRFYRGMDCLQKHIDTIVPDRDFCSKAERRGEQDG